MEGLVRAGKMMQMREKEQAQNQAFRAKRSEDREKLLAKTKLKNVDDAFDQAQGKQFEV